ncbi:HAD family hydrolase [Sporomusa aerivorans]|uniref:HAD family hydrolase n=1 Tax=Sporomusa aerivorans TaxID=204936 RepID=UPI00352ABFBF
MIKSVLFDLDGTLLPLDQDAFLREYLRLFGIRVAGIVEPKKFIDQLLASTMIMIGSNDRTKTNQQVFFEDFLPNIGVDEAVLLPVINDFYKTDFCAAKVTSSENAAARRAVTTVALLGLDVVVATNPVFPLAAVKQRLGWAGLSDIKFSHITSYEHCHFCKPNPEYYLEVARRIDRKPEECLMVGNDVEEDLIAATIGMKTFLVTDYLLNQKKLAYTADYQGTLQELAESIGEIIMAENGTAGKLA